MMSLTGWHEMSYPAVGQSVASRDACASKQIPRLRWTTATAPLIVLDPGHGGHDPGSLGGNGRYAEKDAALSMAKAARSALVSAGLRVQMTRTGDRFVSLYERREIARRHKAALFISIHADSAIQSTARGATIYTLSDTASDLVAARLAARENMSNVLSGIDLDTESPDVASMLLNLTQRETMNASARFSTSLRVEEEKLGIRFKTASHRYAGFAVLKAPDVPAILFESGYMSSAPDLALLFSKQYHERVAAGIAIAVRSFFEKVSPPATCTAFHACTYSTLRQDIQTPCKN